MTKREALEQLLKEKTREYRMEAGSLQVLQARLGASDKQLGAFARPTGLKMTAQTALVERLQLTVEALTEVIELYPEGEEAA